MNVMHKLTQTIHILFTVQQLMRFNLNFFHKLSYFQMDLLCNLENQLTLPTTSLFLYKVESTLKCQVQTVLYLFMIYDLCQKGMFNVEMTLYSDEQMTNQVENDHKVQVPEPLFAKIEILEANKMTLRMHQCGFIDFDKVIYCLSNTDDFEENQAESSADIRSPKTAKIKQALSGFNHLFSRGT